MFKFTKQDENIKTGNAETTLLNALRPHIRTVYNVAEQFTEDKHINALRQERDRFLAINNAGDCFKRIYLDYPGSFDNGLMHGAGSAKVAFAQLLFQHGRSYLNNENEANCLIVAGDDDNVDGTNLGNRINDRIDFLRGEGNYEMPSLEPK
jgi:hypothetical protein